ncbi:enoyl-CoA hydratase [Rhodoligotrophos appendicifer]|uniref:enoyl-CoA hydratase/isomerase family protein n=1 Tax=Rhodoligotrophos appendicifer TaxID=987056 RepID=UPI0011868965|nr:enoyl-CoA hydratase/isomerase family protein [Rhodoligotrophos appendicifer]
MSPAPLTAEVTDGVGLITLARPDKLNCLSSAMLEGLAAALDRFEAEPAVRAILICAQGKHFCAGADLEEVKGLRQDPVALEAFFRRGHELLCRFEASDLPVVAAVQGACLAGGLELVLASDVVFAAETASFGDQHAQYGLFPGWGATQRLPRLIGMRRALDLMFTAGRLDARKAESWGLVNHVTDADKLQAEAMAYCAGFSHRSRSAIAAMKRVSRTGAEGTLTDGLESEIKAALTLVMGDDVGEGIRAFEDRRAPQFAK